MNECAEDNIAYYEFLTIIHEISKKSQSIQKASIRTVYQNYDLRVYRKKLDKQIEELDRLLVE